MNTKERRIIVDETFERTVTDVVDAFVREGLTVEALDGGDLRQRITPGDRLRYALLEASLPELRFRAGGCTTPSALLACMVSLFELPGACTMVSVEQPLRPYPLLAALVPRLVERVGDALRLMLRRRSSLEAV